MTHEELLDGIDEMIKDAPGVGLCALPFRIIRDEVADLIKEVEELKSYREDARVLPYQLYAGKCPKCGVVFLDDSTAYCGNCGQKIRFPRA